MKRGRIILYYIDLLIKKGSMLLSYINYNLEVICGGAAAAAAAALS
jgi:hypothetical protein